MSEKNGEKVIQEKSNEGDVVSAFLTVIVPAYNVERFLAKCLDSLLNQLYEILGTLDTVDFYGFSFLDNTVSQLDCHAEDLMNWHEMSTEVPSLRAFCDCSKTIDQ